MENSSGQMEVFMQANSAKIIFKDMAIMNGPMEEVMKETGKIIKCMVKANLSGKIKDFMWVVI